MTKLKGRDPRADNESIVRDLVVRRFPFDLVKSTEIALLKTFAIPEIAKILVDSGEFLNRTQKRYDDTDLLLSLFIEYGHSSKEGIEAIQRINRMHARHPISNDQMLYVLSTFVVEPIVWMQRFAWRPLRIDEQEALFHFWIAVGRRMGIRDLFQTLPAMLEYHEAYEQEKMVFHENNARLYRQVIPSVARMMPFPLGILTKKALPALMSSRLCAAFGETPSSPALRIIAGLSLRLRSFITYLLPTPPHYRTRMKRPTYPDGFTTKTLGV